MTRTNLKNLQDIYAEAMQKFGLERGVAGSKAKHISTVEHYKQLHLENQELEIQQEKLQFENSELEKQQKKLKKVSFGTALNNVFGTGANDEIKHLERKLEERDNEIRVLEERNRQLSSDLQISKDSSLRDAEYIKKLKTTIADLESKLEAIFQVCREGLDAVSQSIADFLKPIFAPTQKQEQAPHKAGMSVKR
jgi:predicted  nucleic acid-binding Zn-ribbon protein